MLAEFKNWWAQPFSADMDAPHWFAFIGLIVLISILWGYILNHISEATA